MILELHKRCRTCKWWDDKHWKLKHLKSNSFIEDGEWGFCRKRKTGATILNDFHFASWALTDAGEFCGEYFKYEETE